MNKALQLSILLGLLAVISQALDVCEKQEDGTRLGHPADCGKYIVCFRGKTTLISSCPMGLHFNRYYGECDFKATAGCDRSSHLRSDDTCECTPCTCGDDTPTTTTVADSSDSTGLPITTGCASDITVCTNASDGAMLAVEGVCNKYYMCNYGCANLFSCPNNLIFNMDTRQCDYPQNYECPWEYIPPTGPSAGPSGIACETHGRCLGKPDGTSFVNLDDCNTYVVCQCECEVDKACPSDLFFDEELGICNWPRDVAGCNANL